MITIEMLNQHMPKKSNIEFVDFEYEHLNNIGYDWFNGLSDDEVLAEKEYILEQAEQGVAFTCLLNKKPVCVFGCLVYWQGVAELWSVIADEYRKMPIHLTKCGQVWGDICEVVYQLHRLEMTVKASDARANKWAIALGFKHESLMEKFNPKGEDFNLYVRINYGR